MAQTRAAPRKIAPRAPSVPISLRVPAELAAFLPVASLTGERSAWVLEAIEDKILKEDEEYAAETVAAVRAAKRPVAK